MITYIVLKCRSPDTDVMRDQGLKALRAELTFEPDFSVRLEVGDQPGDAPNVPAEPAECT